MARIDGRGNNELRPVRIVPGFLKFAEGSVLIEQGSTQVLCAVTYEDKVPPFLKGSGTGWVTAEYGMLPRSTLTRTAREGNRTSGRTHEIQRLVGRSLRAATDLRALRECTLTVDCDVLQADGGTRTASITGAYVALYQACQTLVARKLLSRIPLTAGVAAVSAGVVYGETLLDLCYEEDVHAEVDCNIVMTTRGEFVEVQGTGEKGTFSRDGFNGLLNLAEEGIRQLFKIQQKSLESLVVR